MATNPPARVSSKLLVPLALVALGASPARAEGPLPSPALGGPDDALQMPAQYVLGRGAVTPKVVVLGMKHNFPGEAWSEVEQRTAAELRTMGLEVVKVEARAREVGTRLAELGAQAVAHRALAAVRVVRRGDERRVQLWLYDAVTGKMVLRQSEVANRTGRQAGGFVALQVIELLHASLLELRLPNSGLPRRPVPPIAKKIVSQLLDKPRPLSAWALTVKAGTLSSFADLGTSAGLSLGTNWRPLPWLALGAEVFVSLLGAQVDQGAAEASFNPYIIRGLVQVAPWPQATLSPRLGLGLGTIIARSAAEDQPPLAGRSDWAAALLPSLHGGLALRLAPTLRAVLDCAVSLSAPALSVSFADQEVARGGRPQVELGLGIEWRWWRNAPQ